MPVNISELTSYELFVLYKETITTWMRKGYTLQHVLYFPFIKKLQKKVESRFPLG